ncbi:hypothetical protein P7K49_024022, partial [Saguinus oedipus]
MAISRQERHRNASAAGYKASALPPHPLEDRGASRARRLRSLRREPLRGAPLPGPQGGAALRGEAGAGSARRQLERLPTQHRRSRGAASQAAGQRHSRSRSRRSQARRRRTEPHSEVNQGKEAEGSPSPTAGPRPGHRVPAQAQAFLFLLAPSPSPQLAWASHRLQGAVSRTYTTALEIIQDTIFTRAWAPRPGGWAQNAADQAANGRPRASPAPRAFRGRADALGSRAWCVRATALAARRSVPRPPPPAGPAAEP